MRGIEYIPENFNIEELVHPWVLNKIGVHNSWLRLDSGVLRDLDLIRKEWGSSIFINIGVHDSRGLRPPNDPDGSYHSVHKQGKAFDLVPATGDYRGLWRLVHRMVLEKKLESINTLEDFRFTRGWVHVAKMNTSLRPLIIKP